MACSVSFEIIEEELQPGLLADLLDQLLVKLFWVVKHNATNTIMR